MDPVVSVQNKNFSGNTKSLQKIMEPNRKRKVIYTDNALEFGKACEDLSWNHCTSTPHRSEVNGIAERAVRRIKEGTFAVLLQSGLDEPEFCSRLVKTASIWSKSLAKFFLGYSLHAGGIWKGDILVADIDELEEMDASGIYAKRLNAKQVFTPMSGEKLIFPIADGTVKLSGGDQDLTTSTKKSNRITVGDCFTFPVKVLVHGICLNHREKFVAIHALFSNHHRHRIKEFFTRRLQVLQVRFQCRKAQGILSQVVKNELRPRLQCRCLKEGRQP